MAIADLSNSEIVAGVTSGGLAIIYGNQPEGDIVQITLDDDDLDECLSVGE